MDNTLFLDSDQRFLKPDFTNSSVSSISSVIRKLDLIASQKLPERGKRLVGNLRKERGKQNRIQKKYLMCLISKRKSMLII